MKRIFTFAIALMSLLVTAKAATAVFNVTVPDGTNACYMVGNFNKWNNVGVKCTKVDATHYTITLDEATFADNTITLATLEYKYLSGSGDWAYVEKDAAGAEITNRKFTASPTADVVAKWASIWKDVPPIPGYQTIDVLVPAGTFECYIVGNFNSWAGPTAPADSCKMKLISTNTDGTKIFEKAVYSSDANKLAYHFCSGPDWSFEQSAPTGDYHYPDVNVVVTAWKKVYDPSTLGNVKVVATVPAGTGDKVWIQGGFLGWNFANGGGGQLMTKNTDGTFSYTISNTPGTEYRLYNRQDWGFPEVDATGAERANRVLPVTPGQTTTENITVIAWKQAYNTKVDEVNIDNYRIYTNSSRIVVEGVTSNVELFSLEGRRVQSEKLSGTFTSQTLNKGLYVVRVDGVSRKVSVN